MRLLLDPRTGTHALHEPQDLTRFSVVVPRAADLPLDPRDVPTSLAHVDDDGEHLLVQRSALVALAGPAADDPRWQSAFEAMLAYAATRGWVTPDGTGIRAHCTAADSGDTGAAS